MKTQIQILLGCGKNYGLYKCGDNSTKRGSDGKKILCTQCKALLQYSEEIIEEIENRLKKIIIKINVFEKARITPERRLVHYSLLRNKDMLESFKQSIIGSERKI